MRDSGTSRHAMTKVGSLRTFRMVIRCEVLVSRVVLPEFRGSSGKMNGGERGKLTRDHAPVAQGENTRIPARRKKSRRRLEFG
jgi:hypothetical protein